MHAYPEPAIDIESSEDINFKQSAKSVSAVSSGEERSKEINSKELEEESMDIEGEK
jgi:hypothetical protein